MLTSRMQAAQVSSAGQSVTIDGLFSPALFALGQLVSGVRNGSDVSRQVSHVQDLLETLPVTANDFSMACGRLKNAQRYLASNERGAARWELDMLSKQLTRQAQIETVEPRRRNYAVQVAGEPV